MSHQSTSGDPKKNLERETRPLEKTIGLDMIREAHGFTYIRYNIIQSLGTFYFWGHYLFLTWILFFKTFLHSFFIRKKQQQKQVQCNVPGHKLSGLSCLSLLYRKVLFLVDQGNNCCVPRSLQKKTIIILKAIVQTRIWVCCTLHKHWIHMYTIYKNLNTLFNACSTMK